MEGSFDSGPLIRDQSSDVSSSLTLGPDNFSSSLLDGNSGLWRAIEELRQQRYQPPLGNYFGADAPLLRQEVRAEAQRTRRHLATAEDVTAGNIVAAGRAQREIRLWNEETDEAFKQLGAAERELSDIQRAFSSAERSQEAWLAARHEEAVARSAESAEALAKLRQDTHAFAARGRLEARQLEQEIQEEQRTAELRLAERANIARSVAEAVGQSARHAIAAFRPRRDLSEAQEAIDATMDWLFLVEKAFSLVAKDGADIGTTSAAAPSEANVYWNASGNSLQDVCEAMCNSASLMGARWQELRRCARDSADLLAYERQLVDELHAERERECTIEADLAERHHRISELRASIDFEDQQTATTLREQRWLVPRVAAAVEATRKPRIKYSRGRPPAWDEWDRGRGSTTLSPAAWAGFHCDRDCDRSVT